MSSNVNYILTQMLKKKRYQVTWYQSTLLPCPHPAQIGCSPAFTGVSCCVSVLLYVDTTKHRYILFPHLFFFFFVTAEGECRIHTVLYLAFSLPVSLRSFHFCTERASSFFLHCVGFHGWAILYLTHPHCGMFGSLPSFYPCKQPTADGFGQALFCTVRVLCEGVA